MEDVTEQLEEGKNSPADPQINLSMEDFINHFASRTSPEVTARDRSPIQREDLSEGADSISCQKISGMRRWQLRMLTSMNPNIRVLMRHNTVPNCSSSQSSPAKNSERPSYTILVPNAQTVPERKFFCNIIGKWIGYYDLKCAHIVPISLDVKQLPQLFGARMRP